MRPRPSDTHLTPRSDTLAVRPGGLAASPAEGRVAEPLIGLDDAASLGAIAGALRGLPHGRVLHLGAGGDSLTGSLESRLVADRGGTSHARPTEGPFDVVVSRRTLPIDRLPELPSETPETYRRGGNLELALARPTTACRELSEALASARRLGRVGGHVILLERLPGLSQALLFARLLCGAGLLVHEWRRVDATSPVASFGGGRGCALVVAEIRPGPVPFREKETLAALLPSPAKTTLHRLPRPGSGGRLARSGPEAEYQYLWLSRDAKEVRVSGRRPDGRAFRARFGVVEPPAAYLYFCDTEDGRELDVADFRLAWDLFAPAAERYASAGTDGTDYDVHPPAETLFTGLRTLLGT